MDVDFLIVKIHSLWEWRMLKFLMTRSHHQVIGIVIMALPMED